MTVRIDKWLCASRFFKTRGLASTEIQRGRVVLNGERIKPAKQVKVGDALVIRKGPYEYRVQVLALAEHLFKFLVAAAAHGTSGCRLMSSRLISD